MSRQPQNIADSSIGRVFIRRSTGQLAGCYDFVPATGIGGISQDKTEDIVVRVPSTTRAGKYDTLDKITGDANNITFDMTELLSLGDLSSFRRYFSSDCLYEIAVHYGLCTTPSNFATFTNAIVFENVSFSTYGTDNLVALTKEDKAPITQTVSASATSMYQHLFTLRWASVASFTDVDATNVFQLTTDNCNGPCNFSSCKSDECSQNFVAMADTVVEADVYSSNIYTVSANGTIFSWDYNALLQELVSCAALRAISLEVGETVTAAKLKQGTRFFVVGTNLGRIIEYDLLTQEQQDLALLTDEITAISANDFGYLAGTITGDVYYAENITKYFVAAGSVESRVTTLFLYNKASWLAAAQDGLLYYTNNSGGTYSATTMQYIPSNPITAIEATNKNILHAVNSGRYYQSIDAGCTWVTIDLSNYLSEITDVIVCKTNPFVVYLVGLSTDGRVAHIIKSNFGVE